MRLKKRQFARRQKNKNTKNLLYVAKDADVVGFHEIYCHTLPPIPFRKEKKDKEKIKKKIKKNVGGNVCIYTGVCYTSVRYILRMCVNIT